MAVSTDALTLAQYAIMSNDPLVKRITYSLLQNANVLDDLPLVTKKTMIVNGVRWQGNLPSVNWSQLNVDPVVTSGTPNAYQEQAYIVRNAIDVDRFLVEDENQIVDPRGGQVDAWLKALSYDLNDKWINNDHSTGNANSFVGLRKRMDDYTTWGVVSEMKIDGGGVDMTQGAMSAATANNFIEFIQQMLDYMGAPEGQGVVFYMNDVMKRRFERAVRLLGAGAGFTMTQDAYDRPIPMYKSAKIRDIGRKADQTTRVITTTEASTGAAGASTYTSIYAAKFSVDDGIFGWQFEALQPKDIGLIGNGGSTYRFLMDWAFGLYNVHTRAICRLYGIKLA